MRWLPAHPPPQPRTPFEFPFFQEFSPAELEQISPDPTTYDLVDDFATMTFSGSGEVTAPTQAVDVTIPPLPEPGSTSGCEDADFAGFVPGNIALIQRGTCTFADKALNADEAGASAVIIFNEGQVGRTETLTGTLGAIVTDLPVVGVSFDVGVDLANPDGTVVRVKTDTASELRITNNVIAQTRTGRTNNVVTAGAHLDSVLAGPGINDNGSGSAAILAVALRLATFEPVNQVRFAWWSAEELGLVGSTYYVNSLTDEERGDIKLYLNFDMVGSPNFVRSVYDGDGSDFGLVGPPGSDDIEALFNDHFADETLPFQATAFSGRSDYQAFINNGIPAGGLFTGAEGIKTEEEAALYGGVAGEQYDPCYHQACDSRTPVQDGADASLYAALAAEYGLIGNVNPLALDTNVDAIAHAVGTYAVSTASVTESLPTVSATAPVPGQAGDLAS